VHVRRALLLFAVVLGLAALAAAVSQPRQSQRESRSDTPPAATATMGPRASTPPEMAFPSRGRPVVRRLELGRSATVVVHVAEPGQVALEGLGLLAPAEPLTPARFEVLAGRPGRHRLRFTPAGTDEEVTVGTLVFGS
jgi:hypothetical protein